MSGASRTITSLRRWSCQDKQLPSVEVVKAIHIYDFDNTLFASPLPNKQIWNAATLGHLQALASFANGGWWHDSSILASTGDGVEVEEPRAWDGWWNESIVSLVQLSMQQADTLTVLLTGRSQKGFADLVSRMVKSRSLEFNMVCLKPAVGPNSQRFHSTMAFKQELLKEMVYTYREAEELRIYEDRPNHTKAFRGFFATMNRGLLVKDPPPPRQPITVTVIQVAESVTSLDPVTEVAGVQRMINSHNAAVLNGVAPPKSVPLQIKRTVFYTGYIVSPADTERLIALVQHPPGQKISENDIRYLANNILITPRPAPKSILDKTDGLGSTMRWRVVGLAAHQSRVWAARVEPVNPSAKVYTENMHPFIVLALGRGAKPHDAERIKNWQPVPSEQALEFETTIGEKILLRVEEERQGEDDWESKFPVKEVGRKHPREEDFPPLGSDRQPPAKREAPQQRANNENRRGGHGGPGGHRGTNHNRARGGFNARGGRGGQQRGGGGQQRGGGGNNGKARGRGNAYKSLDDNAGGRGYSGGGSGGMQY
ncbi:hypothetical protein LTR50_000691 [Elasticomyces elasticus]|nr:hypothetical protein LTR50_000691 [Elasticomyces elasticus]